MSLLSAGRSFLAGFTVAQFIPGWLAALVIIGYLVGAELLGAYGGGGLLLQLRDKLRELWIQWIARASWQAVAPSAPVTPGPKLDEFFG